MAGLADTFPESLPAFQRMFPDDVSCARTWSRCAGAVATLVGCGLLSSYLDDLVDLVRA